tara:strand:- start:108 stop:425 length:318 start_codon:yes stop_codon:yes gene_type:complete
MKSLVKDIRKYFNRRTKAIDAAKEADVNRKTLAIENGESAVRLMLNEDFALMFNLYRFNMLEKLEDSSTDLDRISNAHYVAGVRDFIDFVEKQEYLGKVAKKTNT